ncbi:MAG: hypothetical protein ACR2M3_12775 [Thermomicrobiales bacterium]
MARQGPETVNATPEEETTGQRGAMKRRGLIAGAAALVAGMVAKQASQPVAAYSGGGDQGPFTLGSNPWYIAGSPTANTAATSSAPTVLQATPNYGNFLGENHADTVLFEVDATTSASGNIDGIFSLGHGIGTGVRGAGYVGVHGTSTTGGYGVIGEGDIGVHGESQGSTNGSGVEGLYFGSGTNGIGVKGSVIGGAAGTTAVYGNNKSTGTGGTGVYGQTTNGYFGVLGVAGTPVGAAGVLGYSNTANGAAFGSFVTTPATLAGYCNGIVHVTGPFIGDNPANKHGAIDHSDGTTRLVYSMESPESWIEDFGTGTLSNGKASIALDPGFAGVVHTDEYHVFLTERDIHQHLIVTGQTPTGFTVEADAEMAALKGKKAADLGGTFSYRVVAKPKVGRVVERLPKYTRPTPFDIAAIEKIVKAATVEPTKPGRKP